MTQRDSRRAHLVPQGPDQGPPPREHPPSAHALFQAEGFHLETAKGPRRGGAHRAHRGCARPRIRSKTRVTDKALAAGKRLLSVGCFCIGTNQVDLANASKRGVPVFNAPFSNTRSVAEMILAEIVMLSRRLSDRAREMHAGQWSKVATGSFEVRHKTLGIVGYGHIGRQLGVIAEMLGMHVVFFDVAAKLRWATTARPRRSTSCSRGRLRDATRPRDAADPRDDGRARARRDEGRELPAEREPRHGGRHPGAGGGPEERAPRRRGDRRLPEEPETNSDGFKTPLQGLDNVVLTPHIGGSTAERRRPSDARSAPRW